MKSFGKGFRIFRLESVRLEKSPAPAILIKTAVEHAPSWVEFAAECLDGLAVVMIVTLIAVGTALALIRYVKKAGDAYARYRIVLARTLQVGLELLVAADIIRTVSTPLTMTNLLLLSGVVLVRTFLGWTLTVEIEGRWPWKQAQEPGSQPSSAASQSTAA